VKIQPRLFKRASLFVEGEYRPDFLGGGELYGEALLTKRESSQTVWAQIFPIYHEGSTVNPFRNGTRTVRSFIPNWPSATQTLAQIGFPGIAAQPISLYDVDYKQEVNTYRFLGGVRGDWGKWSYDAYVSHSKSEGTYSSVGIYKDRVNFGTGTNQDTLSLMPGNVCGTGAPAGCVPFNLFTKEVLEDGIFPQAMSDYYFLRDIGNTDYTQTIIEGSVTGDLISLPAGPVGAAFGFAVRQDEINDVPGAQSQAGNLYQRTTAGITAGKDTLSEVYGEFEAPIVRGKPFFEDLKLNVSARYSDYDSIGADTTYKLGVNWAVDNILRLRATYGTSFRAPGLFELFLKDQTGFLNQSSVDPCINYGQIGEGGGFARNERVRTNCAAEGLSPTFAGGSSSAQVKTGGGSDLTAETSKATTFGIILTPPETGFKLAIDFWKIVVSDQISSSGAAIVGACYNSFDFPNNGFCNSFTRSPADDGIETIDARYRNIPTESTSGIDFTASYKHEFNFGTLYMDLEATHVRNYKQQLFKGDVINDYQGLIGEPAWNGRIRTNFEYKDWTFYHGFNYVGATENLDRYGEDGITSAFYAAGATYRAGTDDWFTQDVSVRYEGKTFTIVSGISNILDEEPPVIGDTDYAPRVGNYPRSSQYVEGYLGRQFFTRVSKKF
jgi:iron complex outermembrane recepter protein